MEEQQILVHSLLLRIHSEVFEAMFKSKMKEFCKNEIIISDFSAEVVKSFVDCIYDSKCIELNLLKCGTELIKMFHKYSVASIISEIEKIISKAGFLTCDNVVEYLTLATAIDNQVIQTKSLEFITNNLSTFTDNDAYMDGLDLDMTKRLLRYLPKNVNQIGICCNYIFNQCCFLMNILSQMYKQFQQPE